MTTLDAAGSPTLRVAAAQIAAEPGWEANLATIVPLIARAADDGVQLCVFPEGVQARFTDDIAQVRSSCQPLDGPFLTGVAEATTSHDMTVVVGVHEKRPDDPRPFNTLVAVRAGNIVASYRKLHLYDAFATAESEHVTPGDTVAPLLDVDGFQVGLMTCYDVRFPELARLLAQAGAELLVLPAAWVKGPQKERHWQTLVAARALENTVWVVGAGECGRANIGCSMIVDPLGVPVAQAADQPALVVAEIDRARLTDARRQLPCLENRRFAVDARPHREGSIGG